ncbi:MAG: NirA family protein, partial [Planctomycetales bacterium]|nr:NirA family protein [Planctomycetales bacterium]
LSRPLRRCSLDLCSPRSPVDRQAHVDFHPQSQQGLYYVGVVLPVGRLAGEQMHALADIADRFGRGELRLTVWQNLLIPHIAEGDIEDVKHALAAIGLEWQATSVRAGLVACTGNTGCKFAASNTKGQAMILARYLEERITLDQPINIHLTGCHHSCAQHYIGDIGLLATQVEVGDDMVEGYHIHVGGGYGVDQAMAREIFPAVAFADIPPLVERILAVYVERRVGPEESFVNFTRRYDMQQLKAMVEQLEAMPV